MVADKVEVRTKKIGEEKGFIWTSDGKSGYEIEAFEKDDVGTEIKLFLNDNGREYASRWSATEVLKKYSNHIAFPIFLHYEETKTEGEGDDKKETLEQKVEQVNDATAFWKRSKAELKKKDYDEFYKTFSNDYSDPQLHIHTQAEGALDYTTLFYIPSKAPMDLYYAEFKAGVKLYVKRVFITDDDKNLLPVYLRFVKGIIDSEDLPLNVSREILQQNLILEKIRKNSVKKILSALKIYSKNAEKYNAFYAEFGRPLKEGYYQDHDNRDVIAELVRFKSTKADGLTSLADYVSRMGESQKDIYYVTGENEASIRRSPLLEMYNKKDVEVLILDDEIDEIVIPGVSKYKEYAFKSVNRSSATDELGEEKIEEKEKAEKDAAPLIKKLKRF